MQRLVDPIDRTGGAPGLTAAGFARRARRSAERRASVSWAPPADDVPPWSVGACSDGASLSCNLGLSDAQPPVFVRSDCGGAVLTLLHWLGLRDFGGVWRDPPGPLVRFGSARMMRGLA